MNKNIIIIAAGGNGERMAVGFNKIFLKLLKEPIIHHTLKAFEDCEIIDEILITAKLKDFGKLHKVIRSGRFKKIKKMVTAAASRQESTWEVLQRLKLENLAGQSLVGIHNAVNPLVSVEEIKKVYESARQHGAALLAIPAKDTVRIADQNNFSRMTPPRQFVWYAETPQVARFDLLFKAYRQAAKTKDWGTDDAMLIEKLSKKVKIVSCSWENFKVTFTADVVAAKEVLKRRENV